MSAVTLLCTDRPMPLYDSGVRRVETSSHGGYTVSIETEGFSVRENSYYRPAVDELGLDLKPCQYELNLRTTREDAAELWHLWVGSDREERIPRFRGRLADLDGETLEQFCNPPLPRPRTPWQCRMIIEI